MEGQMKNKKGFTLVELVIVIIIVGILSIVGVTTYRNYVQRAMETEGVALLGTLAKAEDIYYTIHGEYYNPGEEYISSDDNIGVDCRGNKYFTKFRAAGAYWLLVRCDEKNTTFRMRIDRRDGRVIDVTYENLSADSWQRYK